MVTIKIIIGSTRPNRFGPKLANWLMELAKKRTDAQFELIDLEQVNLPLLDEPDLPSTGNYQQDHTKKWSAMVEPADGFIWVHPEYNHGVNAALKNAIDFLWKEWNDKPVTTAGYGAEAGGARAAEQLRLIAVGCKMFPLRTALHVGNYRQYLNESGEFTPTDLQVKAANAVLDEITFWAEQMKRSRGERSK